MFLNAPAPLQTTTQNEQKQMTKAAHEHQLPLFDDIRTLSESETQPPASQATEVTMDDEKRSPASGIAHMVQQLTAPIVIQERRNRGVGDRRSTSPAPGGRGGYPNISGTFETRRGLKKSADPRLDELYTMGLQQYWLDVAEYLGVDAFLGMWRVLDSHRDNMPDGGRRSSSMTPTLRPYSSYLRFQKNRFVENLVKVGVSPKEIQKRVQTQLCETISIVHISRLANKNKIK